MTTVLTESPVVTAADVLERAALILEEWNWCQGQLRDGDSFCMLGAIAFASGMNPYDVPDSWDMQEPPTVYEEAVGVLSSVCPHKARWNDQEGRTKEEVIAMLREAAERGSNA